MRHRPSSTAPGAARPDLPPLPGDGEARYGAYRRAVLTDLGPDFRLGFKLAYFASFAVPAIAGPLDASNEIARQPMRRAKDTSIVVYEIIANGLGSERGLAMVDLLRRVHRGVPGSGDDFRYVLLTLLVVPVRMVDRAGPRRLTDAERTAAAAFYADLGAAIGLADVPTSLDEAAAFCRGYEARNAIRSDAGDRLVASTLGALLDPVPAALRPLAGVVARSVLSALFGDRRMALALGLPVVPVPVARIVAAVRRAGRRGADGRAAGRRASGRRASGLEERIAFTSGEPSRVYPAGYTLDQIGPGASAGPSAGHPRAAGPTTD